MGIKNRRPLTEAGRDYKEFQQDTLPVLFANGIAVGPDEESAQILAMGAVVDPRPCAWLPEAMRQCSKGASLNTFCNWSFYLSSPLRRDLKSLARLDVRVDLLGQGKQKVNILFDDLHNWKDQLAHAATSERVKIMADPPLTLTEDSDELAPLLELTVHVPADELRQVLAAL